MGDQNWNLYHQEDQNMDSPVLLREGEDTVLMESTKPGTLCLWMKGSCSESPNTGLDRRADCPAQWEGSERPKKSKHGSAFWSWSDCNNFNLLHLAALHRKIMKTISRHNNLLNIHREKETQIIGSIDLKLVFPFILKHTLLPMDKILKEE